MYTYSCVKSYRGQLIYQTIIYITDSYITIYIYIYIYITDSYITIYIYITNTVKIKIQLYLYMNKNTRKI